MLRLFSALLAGLVFGGGLVLSGMSDPTKVAAFLDLAAITTGGWDPSLAFVMGGGLLVTLPGFALARRRAGPAFSPAFEWPTRRDIDGRLVAGSVIFGIGWGVAGICPGPGLTLLALDPQAGLVFVLAMLAGMVAFKFVPGR